MAEQVGKILDLVISPKTVKNYNYMENVQPEVFAKVILNIFGGSEAKNPIWNNAGYSLLYYTIVFHQALIKLKGAKKSPAAHMETLRHMSKPVDENNRHPILDQFSSGEAKIEIMKEGTILNDALKEFIAFHELANETKSSVVFTVSNWMKKFIQSKALRPWANSETSDFAIRDTSRQGKKYGILLPEGKYGAAGLAIQALAKADLYNEVKNRGDNSLKKGYSRVFLFVDECQRFLDDMDLAILPEARSLELVCWFASQNIDSIYDKFGKDGGGKFMGAFASVFSYKSTPATYHFIKERIGKAKVIEKNGGAETVDFERNAQLQMGTPFFDITNPHRKMMKNFTFGYMKSFFTNNPTNRVIKPDEKNVKIGSENIKETFLHRHGGLMPTGARISISKDPEYIFNERGIAALETPFRAVGTYPRGDVTRRAIFASIPYSDDFTIIDTSIKSANEVIERARQAKDAA
ncbi:hypothetical protein A8E81_10855 [Burkholderia cenocepacia]|nr:hypothetical protein A8E75_30760 [Burkholderia cenocepacia]ONV25315.1 hypothetical protein A8E74_09840 [Burkholderia cenocepacia]ONV30561.1 hypothetical protein A8E78_17285 [Burkholderia cenocepacia]ONV33478.1 hypothetical protein A8E77_16005 [Burkholderia cenocepacia]ONV55329.1 hypothetical protein A8E81_10855 [Burkholderia cenocepacia]